MDDPFDFPDETVVLWHCDPKDRDPRPEGARQLAFLRKAKIHCPAVDIIAVPNAAKRGLKAIRQAKKEGMKSGALDLIATWAPTRPGDRGVCFIEFKNGEEPPSPNQRDRLNMLTRMGHQCGVFRQEASALTFLRLCGAPFLNPEKPGVTTTLAASVQS